eukprot:TRINITY_DN43988_c0_g1_i1.p1 TRINITY_DN43988_c0_g1~~TRINITY_DN43988_c0_g1_i1.p1  ORF type:complete len:392 (+),score=48.84 TRINITY_DN43988_c0_g1_i1:56-1231(+)
MQASQIASGRASRAALKASGNKAPACRVVAAVEVRPAAKKRAHAQAAARRGDGHGAADTAAAASQQPLQASRPAARRDPGRCPAPCTAHCVCCLRSPMLIAAPHGKELWRDGDYGNATCFVGRRLHRRECHVTALALSLSGCLEPPAGFAVWDCNRAKSADEATQNADPGYLQPSEHSGDEWHAAVHSLRNAWAGSGETMFVVDLHGKLDRCDPSGGILIDAGIEPVRIWMGAEAHSAVKDSIRRHLGTWAARSHLPRKTGVHFPGPGEPRNGAWQTMRPADSPDAAPRGIAEQACKLGIPAVLLEVPSAVRRALRRSPKLQTTFARALSCVHADMRSLGIGAVSSAAASPCYPDVVCGGAVRMTRDAAADSSRIAEQDVHVSPFDAEQAF